MANPRYSASAATMRATLWLRTRSLRRTVSSARARTAARAAQALRRRRPDASLLHAQRTRCGDDARRFSHHERDTPSAARRAGNPEYTIRVMKGYAQTYFFDRASFAFPRTRA